MIDLEAARMIAEKYARHYLEGYATDPSEPLLEPRYFEAEHCWIFLCNRAIQDRLPASRWYSRSTAFAISRNGTFRSISDFDRDPEQLAAFAQKMSEYFATSGE